MFSMESGNVNKKREWRKHLIGMQVGCFGFIVFFPVDKLGMTTMLIKNQSQSKNLHLFRFISEINFCLPWNSSRPVRLSCFLFKVWILLYKYHRVWFAACFMRNLLFVETLENDAMDMIFSNNSIMDSFMDSENRLT